MKKALVTGGAGFIGSHLADRLLKEGYEVVVIDNESTGYREYVPKEATYIKGDIRDLEKLVEAFEHRLDVVFHVAGQASTFKSFQNPHDDLSVNLSGTINVINLCLEYKVPRLLYASSMTTYGHPEKLPISETERCNPISYYGISKFAAERFVHATAERNDLEFKFQTTSFRMFNVYGERQSLNNPYQGVTAIFISNLLEKKPVNIHSDGEQTRDFIYIGDVIEAWIKSMNYPNSYGNTFNIGSGKSKSINTLVDSILSSFDLSRESYKVIYSPERPGDQRFMEADISKARSILNWEPKVSFDQGIERTIQWAMSIHKKNRK